MKRINHLLFTICFISLCSTAFAQNRDISGKITSTKDQVPVPGATVTIKGTNRSVAASNDGSFTISAPQRRLTLTISSINFTAKEVSVGAEENNIVINLEENTAQLTDEV